MAGDKLHDRYDNISMFEVLLEEARMNALDEHGEQFVADVIKKYDKWGGGMFWSDKQDAYLRKISGE